MRQQNVLILEHFCTYEYGLQLYTLRFETSEVSLAADFYSRMREKAEFDEDIKSQLQHLETSLERIDRRHYSLFTQNCLRHERQASALPSKPSFLRHLGIEENIALRLYCYPAGDRTLILFSGDIKTQNDPEQCPQVGRHFRSALIFATKLNDVANEWEIDSNGCINWEPPELFL